ncbi:MAG: Holliday junction resolvase RuvX [Gammaproteobacteria bacterium]|nr:Holliday junction resolvase RuvX [Gammaproteobacteria bacterium]
MASGSGAHITLLAFDYGLRRTGVATGETRAGLTRGVATLLPRSGEIDWTAIAALIREWQPDLLVVGLPYNADGTDSAMTLAARAFAEELARRSALRVDTVDERHSSGEAQARLREQRSSGLRRRRVRREDIDREAARVIARQWLHEHHHLGED